MNKSAGIIVFTLIRLALFFVPLGILLLFNANPYLSAIISALFGFAVSLLWLDKLKNTLLNSENSVFDGSKKPTITTDEEIEDALIDSEVETNAAIAKPAEILSDIPNNLEEETKSEQ